MRAICTSASLQASTGVSPGFTLFRHSSPPFGSKQAHSNSSSVEPGRCWAFVLCAHHGSCDLPFSTRDGTCMKSSPLRVCLTPWSVFQDGWRHPILCVKLWASRKWAASPEGWLHITSARFTGTPVLHLLPNKSLRVLPGECLGGRPWPMSWRYVHCRCHDFRFYVTLFPKCFSNFRSRYLFAIGLPTLYLTLADTYLPLHTAFPSSATLLMPYHEVVVSGSTG